MDLTKMKVLDLGDPKNYKTRLIQKRWDQQRSDWLTKKPELVDEHGEL